MQHHETLDDIDHSTISQIHHSIPSAVSFMSGGANQPCSTFDLSLTQEWVLNQDAAFLSQEAFAANQIQKV
jgi:hypothetical protein